MSYRRETVMYLPNGKKVKLYPIGVLAEALGRCSQTIRKWEISGILPRTMFEDSRKVRLYTQEQIDIIVKCAEECQLSAGSAPSRTRFRKMVHEELAVLAKKYLRKRGTKIAEEAMQKNKELINNEG